MNTIAKVVSAAVIAASVAGCGQFALNPGSTGPSAGAEADTGQAKYLRDSSVRGSSDEGKGSAVEEALEWMKKYSKAADQLARAQEALRSLQEKNGKLLAQNVKLRTEHEVMKRELEDASAQAVEIRRELDRWKADVLGFRKEIRDAEKAELEILTRIMILVGGEAPKKASGKTPVPPAATKPPKDKDADKAGEKDLTHADAN